MKGKRARKTESTTLLDEQKRRTRALAVREELRNAEKEGKLVQRAAVEKAWFRLAREVRDGLENIAARIAGQVAAEKKQDKCYEIIQREVRQVLETLSKAQP